MLIELHPLFSAYNKGYLRQSKDGRKRVDLYNSQEDRTTISYARYLVCIREGRILTPDEEVDHEDNDKTNDSLDNLVVLSVDKHREKTLKLRKKTFLEFECPVCKTKFKRRKGLEEKNRVPKCSRSCNGKASRLLTAE